NQSAGGGRPATVDQVIDEVASAAERGFASGALAQLSGIDALTLIALAGRVVPGIELQTAVVPIYPRHPTALAQQALTVNAAIGGRLVLGIGLAHKPVVEQRWGMSFERPVAYMREYLAILMPLLRGEAADFKGARLTGQQQLSFAEAPAPTVLLAALGEHMLRLAGAHTDGTSLWMVGPRTLADHITPTITRAAEQAGRPAPRIVAGLPICVTSDVPAARERAARSLANYNRLPSYRAMLDREGVDGPGDVLIAGSEDAVDRELARLADAGATEFLASPLGSSDDRRRTAEFLNARIADARRTAV
ncbi:MAG: TIGR03564 family F420-dependent LLM class oxidoreductase, partial [Chloroflexi bacterium]|nr:TIGR03564 family F420-dependent LLM class oxidoreductase [Chloroflexota bacterium]